MWQKVKFKTLNCSAYYCRKTDNRRLNWVHLSSTLCHTVRALFWGVWTCPSMSTISKNSWRPFSSTLKAQRSVCCALMCGICKYSPTWVQIVHKTRNSSVYCKKTNKKKCPNWVNFSSTLWHIGWPHCSHSLWCNHGKQKKCLLCIAFVMSESREQCKCIKCYAELKIGTPTYDMIKTALEEESISRMEVFYRFRCFREGCTPAESDEHSGHPSTSRKMKW